MPTRRADCEDLCDTVSGMACLLDVMIAS
jgi:hypothetical protein